MKRRFKTAALIMFLSGHALVWPALVFYLVHATEERLYGLPMLLGPFFLLPSNWLTIGFVLACLCFVASIALKNFDVTRSRRDQHRTGAATWAGRVLLSIITCGVMIVALFHVALSIVFPTGFQRLAPSSEGGCQVVLETRTAAASQNGRVLLQPPSANSLIETGITWSYDDGQLIDPDWAVSWTDESATLHAPEGVFGSDEPATTSEDNRAVSFDCR
ncbi:hypothetical protein [Microbacterium halotolerans]|uniref:hypothetical protein n=1 Tax=Microbacterium halotolerans TaxID=246613 RepID=UPI000E6A9D7A|nr:hypothetical protein [Microbacterium halotolerans]